MTESSASSSTNLDFPSADGINVPRTDNQWTIGPAIAYGVFATVHELVDCNGVVSSTLVVKVVHAMSMATTNKRSIASECLEKESRRPHPRSRFIPGLCPEPHQYSPTYNKNVKGFDLLIMTRQTWIAANPTSVSTPSLAVVDEDTAIALLGQRQPIRLFTACPITELACRRPGSTSADIPCDSVATVDQSLETSCGVGSKGTDSRTTTHNGTIPTAIVASLRTKSDKDEDSSGSDDDSYHESTTNSSTLYCRPPAVAASSATSVGAGDAMSEDSAPLDSSNSSHSPVIGPFKSEQSPAARNATTESSGSDEPGKSLEPELIDLTGDSDDEEVDTDFGGDENQRTDNLPAPRAPGAPHRLTLVIKSHGQPDSEVLLSEGEELVLGRASNGRPIIIPEATGDYCVLKLHVQRNKLMGVRVKPSDRFFTTEVMNNARERSSSMPVSKSGTTCLVEGKLTLVHAGERTFTFITFRK